MLPMLMSLIMAGLPLPFAELVAPPEQSPQELWMDALANCESMGSTTIRVWDTNNQWSVGKYQYQYRTWLKYSKRFGTTKENITDGELQDKVTRYVLDTIGSGDWHNCGKIVRKALGPYPF